MTDTFAVHARTALSPEWDHGFDEAFTELVTGDPDWVRDEFDALIGANFDDPPAPPEQSARPEPPAPPEPPASHGPPTGRPDPSGSPSGGATTTPAPSADEPCANPAGIQRSPP